MNSDQSYPLDYTKAVKLTPETTTKEIQQLYSTWSRTYDKVSVNDCTMILHNGRVCTVPDSHGHDIKLSV